MNREERQKIEAEYLVQRQRSPKAVTEAPRYPCGHLKPESVPGRLDPPASECVWCKQEAEGNRPTPVGKPRIIPLVDGTSPSQWERMERVREAHPEWFGDGLTREQREQAIAQMDAAREEERAREANQRQRREAFDRPRLVFIGGYGLQDCLFRRDGGV